MPELNGNLQQNPSFRFQNKAATLAFVPPSPLIIEGWDENLVLGITLIPKALKPKPQNLNPRP